MADLGPDFVGRSLARTTTTYKFVSGVKAIYLVHPTVFNDCNQCIITITAKMEIIMTLSFNLNVVKLAAPSSFRLT